jgi:hypothetical protein
MNEKFEENFEEKEEEATSVPAELLSYDSSVSIPRLWELTGVSKPTLYNYMRELGIEPERRGKQSYVTQEESEWVGALAALLKNGEAKSAAEAVQKLRSKGLVIPGKEPEISPLKQSSKRKGETLGVDESSSLIERDSSTIVRIGLEIVAPLVEAISKLNVKADVNLTPQIPSLSHYDELERAYEKGWLLSTSELAPLLKMAPGSITKDFERSGFRFVKAGKNGRESAWRVLKIEASADGLNWSNR